MPIQIKLDELLVQRKLKAKQLAEMIDVSETHLSLFRTGKVRGIRFSTLERLCVALNCQPGDLVVFNPAPNSNTGSTLEATSDQDPFRHD